MKLQLSISAAAMTAFTVEEGSSSISKPSSLVRALLLWILVRHLRDSYRYSGAFGTRTLAGLPVFETGVGTIPTSRSNQQHVQASTRSEATSDCD